MATRDITIEVSETTCRLLEVLTHAFEGCPMLRASCGP
jgi:hypothetical protein